MKKLPDAELSVMLAIWDSQEPLTANEILGKLYDKKWHVATLNKFLSRLMDKGFIESVSKIRPKKYWYLVNKNEYKKFESKSFLRKLHMNSFSSLVTSLYDEELSDEDIKEIEALISSKREES